MTFPTGEIFTCGLLALVDVNIWGNRNGLGLRPMGKRGFLKNDCGHLTSNNNPPDFMGSECGVLS